MSLSDIYIRCALLGAHCLEGVYNICPPSPWKEVQGMDAEPVVLPPLCCFAPSRRAFVCKRSSGTISFRLVKADFESHEALVSAFVRNRSWAIEYMDTGVNPDSHTNHRKGAHRSSIILEHLGA